MHGDRAILPRCRFLPLIMAAVKNRLKPLNIRMAIVRTSSERKQTAAGRAEQTEGE